ncbi:hypothetical protein Clacol_003757 [Clathrus columnatus]|uniref:Uncharacterized protein n=1 Tax=Clathrus columnatus TaxID=1419009 RepID=A0AAV5A9X4_9AGAM|nr:hypothetical protein Clacol_003757 [Clathrus columnatus]
MAGSPSLARSRPKRSSMTVTSTAGSAAIMNISKQTRTNSAGTDSDSTPVHSPSTTRSSLDLKRPSRASLNNNNSNSKSVVTSTTNNSKSTPKLVKRPPVPSAGNKSSVKKPQDSPGKPTEKVVSKSRTSLTIHGLSSALHTKGPAPSSLPKYKGKASCNEASERLKGSNSRKRSNDLESDKEDENGKSNDGKSCTPESEDDDEDAEFVQVERPISPLPRRPTRKPLLPVPLSLVSPSSSKRSILHKNSKSLDSPRPKAAKTSTSPVSRLNTGSGRALPRPSSASSQLTSQVSNVGKKFFGSRIRSPLSRGNRRGASPLDETKLQSSPSNPFNVLETSGPPSQSPPESPFREDATVDSIDANDVSAFLTTVVSPVNPVNANTRLQGRKPPAQATVENINTFPSSSSAYAIPQTPLSSRSVSTMSTDPRQSILSIQQLLERSGDIEHLLSQPLPSIFTPEVRERLFSFGFSPEGASSPFTFGLQSEPQTPSPAPDGRSTYPSISRVLFPTFDGSSLSTPTASKAPDTLQSTTIQGLEAQLSSAQSVRLEQDARIEELEKRISNLRESREREASDLALQVKDLEERIHKLLADKERESGERQFELEQQLKDKDDYWHNKLLATITQISNTQFSMQEKERSIERRRSCLLQSVSVWIHTGEIARSELALLHANRRSIEVTLSSLDIFMQKLRLNEINPIL